ncbi:hypothetical protein KRX19_08220 [Cardiobacteriaceae bacterium TAE3-ERU3]|nr:hypothetical protein [Cardiobacteriaceae bacterium TAE3-ERU3]
MTLSKKLTHAMRYMFQRNMVIYWVGSGIAVFLLQHFILSEAAQVLLQQSSTISAANEALLEQLNAVSGELSLYVILSLMVTVLIVAKSLDSAKRISEGDMTTDSLHPVGRIGWGGIGKFIGGSIVISLVLTMIIITLMIFISMLATMLGASVAILLNSLFMLVAIVAVCYAMYASTLVFLETLSYRAMIRPKNWLQKIKLLGKWELAKIILLLFVIGFVFGLIATLFDALFGQLSTVAVIFTLIGGQFLTMFGFVWLGYFVESDVAENTAANEHVARLLYDADTRDMSNSEKERLAHDLHQADSHWARREYDQAIALLEPYTRSETHAPRYFPAYQRLYNWYPQNGEQGKFSALQARIIHIAAQGHERFYQLVDEALFELASENNAQIAANDIYPLAAQALAHKQPDTVLALAKDFRKRQDDHPDVVKIYGCVIQALMLKGNYDIAREVTATMIQQYPDHPDIEIIRELSSKRD